MHIAKPQSKQPIPENATRVFKGVIFDVYQWEQELFDGSRTMFEKLRRPDTVLVVPVTEDGKIILCRQQQPGQDVFVGTFGGRVDEGESPIEAAKRELLEESGYEAADWILLDAHQPVSKIEWAVYIFIARGCRKVTEQDLDGGEKIDLDFVTFDEFVQRAVDPNFEEKELRVKLLEAKLDANKMAELKKLILG
ncbi:NUDIX hydrolase [Candidatus Uhrbacteria bacterium]|nr:NUDIX hydrolase [Candidatus Uhrbacteria bacterium]